MDRLFNARQGDPGSTRYFLSLEDNLFRIFGGEKIRGLMSAFQVRCSGCHLAAALPCIAHGDRVYSWFELGPSRIAARHIQPPTLCAM